LAAVVVSTALASIVVGFALANGTGGTTVSVAKSRPLPRLSCYVG
jgi:hypothetical protein